MNNVVDEFFEFHAYLNQFSDRGVVFKFFTQKQSRIKKDAAKKYGYSTNAVQVAVEGNRDKQLPQISQFYDLLQKTKQKNGSRKDFLENEIIYLESFSKKFREDEHPFMFRALLSYLNFQLNGQGDKTFTSKSKKVLSEAGRKSKRPRNEAKIQAVKNFLSDSGPMKDPTGPKIHQRVNPTIPCSLSWIGKYKDEFINSLPR